MSRFGRHFTRVREIKDFERRLIRLVVDRPGAMSPAQEALFRYAAVMARQHTMRAPDGRDVDVSESVASLQQWMNEAIVGLLAGGDPGVAELEMLREIAPVLALRLAKTRADMLTRHAEDFSAEHLDAEICQKRLVLVLGGGGGAGMVHLGVFSLMHELGHIPELIVGSSMGSILGAMRAIDRQYDPIRTALALPRDLDYNTVFRPFSGYSRFGFPGAFHMNLLRVSREIFTRLVSQSTVHFHELPIPLQVVTTGIRKGFHIDDEAYQGQTSEFSMLALRRRLRTFFGVIQQISQNPRFLAQIVFGKEESTEQFPVVEAIGFSCAVPGLLHYDVYHDDPETIEPLEAVFERHKLARLCDGGVVNNVPSQVAWDTVQQGKIANGSRNAFILGCDVFAPIPSGKNLIWVPIQQVARAGVIANRPYADYHKTFRAPPSPLQVIVNSYSRFKDIVRNAVEELEADRPYIQRALTPLPRYDEWSGSFS